ncbi:DNA-3-methyladenine glycosylase [Xylocopilactobacillus apicola]|uniref:Uncharacterized protein n=1 Tax=Xylocopilactobacillus apicola TaxID=2932184 RepID=A0AAU9DHL7_9LACO|nr:DNA-3-methyladenine glycosylase [Xylocopilactobacillus apicola]BDR57796.1 hypothetical protein XA3_02370 [Xylocopilactobacillus apicola]
MQRINSSFFTGRSTSEITRDLLGKKLVYLTPRGLIAVWIVEVESYLGVNDSAAHAYNGRRSHFVSGIKKSQQDLINYGWKR